MDRTSCKVYFSSDYLEYKCYYVHQQFTISHIFIKSELKNLLQASSVPHFQ
jgi:hypothetical protein